MDWHIQHGDILDIPVDVLICSANVYLTLSGGVGGAFLLRYGNAMQQELQRHLDRHNSRHVERGDVIQTGRCGSPYRAVLHAVAVDGMYDSSPAVVAAVLTRALRLAATVPAQTVAVAALATGYGRLKIADFAQGLAAVMAQDFSPLRSAVLGLRSASDVHELLACVPNLKLVGLLPRAPDW